MACSKHVSKTCFDSIFRLKENDIEMLGHQKRLIFTSNLLVFIKVDTENMSRQYSGRWAVITNRSAGRLLLFQEAVIYLIYKYPFKR